MGHCRIYELEELILGLRLTVQYMVSFVNNLDDLKVIYS